jgi:hypothetical protein
MGYAILAANRPIAVAPREGKPSLQYLARQRRRAIELGLAQDDSPEAAIAQQRAQDARQMALEGRADKRQIAQEARAFARQKELLGMREDSKLSLQEAKDSKVEQMRNAALNIVGEEGDGASDVAPQEKPGYTPFYDPADKAALDAGIMGPGEFLRKTEQRRKAMTLAEAKTAKEAQKERGKVSIANAKANDRKAQIAASLLAGGAVESPEQLDEKLLLAETQGQTPAEVRSQLRGEASEKKASAEKAAKEQSQEEDFAREQRLVTSAQGRSPNEQIALVMRLEQAATDSGKTPAQRKVAKKAADAIRKRYLPNLEKNP